MLDKECNLMPQKVNKETRELISKINKAFRDYSMLSDGDRVIVAMSGGHDSMSLLRLLEMRKALTPERYDLIAVHIIGDSRGPNETPIHEPLIKWLEANRFAYLVTPMQISPTEKLPMNCQRCTWNRRTTLFKVANRLGCNKIAFGHHFDDMVETALLNLFYQGRMATMYPSDTYFGGMFSIIRPLTYVTKEEIKAFSVTNGFPSPPEDCPRSSISKRKMFADILKLADQDYQNIRGNIFRAAINTMKLAGQLKTPDESENLDM
jgi:tRNA 2-thiocytidine biosynthesis protein TtcA